MLQDLPRTYRNLVEDTTRVMLRLQALFRAETSCSELDLLLALWPWAKAVMLADPEPDRGSRPHAAHAVHVRGDPEPESRVRFD